MFNNVIAILPSSQTSCYNIERNPGNILYTEQKKQKQNKQKHTNTTQYVLDTIYNIDETRRDIRLQQHILQLAQLAQISRCRKITSYYNESFRIKCDNIVCSCIHTCIYKPIKTKFECEKCISVCDIKNVQRKSESGATYCKSVVIELK